VEALNLLGRLAAEEGVRLEVCIYGGSAMLLAYSARETTKDVDAILRPAEIGARLARRVAEQLKLHEEWLNDDVKGYVSDLGTFAPLEIAQLETVAQRHLCITRPSASYLLAMKCLACRSPLPGHTGDRDDIRFLIRKMGLKTLAEVEVHLDRFYPSDALTPEARAVIESLLSGQEQP
jgi:hypothetical protein